MVAAGAAGGENRLSGGRGLLGYGADYNREQWPQDVWQEEVLDLGDSLRRLAPVAGSRVSAQVAIMFDWESRWACELDSHPSIDVAYLDRVQAHYEALWDGGVTVDFIHPEADLSPYQLVQAPTLYVTSDAAADDVRDYVAAGGHFLATYFSGIVDGQDVKLGEYPGAFRDVLGIFVEEFFPLQEGEHVRLLPMDECHLQPLGPGEGDLQPEPRRGSASGGTADTWTELLHLRGAEAVGLYADGPLPHVPAVTRHRYGDGVAGYAATRLDSRTTAALSERVAAEAGVSAVAKAPRGVEVVRRHSVTRDGEASGNGDERPSYLFALNHTGEAVDLPARGTELTTGRTVDGTIESPPGAVPVVEER